MDSDERPPQFDTFKDALARRIISRPGFSDDTDDPSGLDDFAAYLASEVWPSLPSSLHTLTYQTRNDIPSLDEPLKSQVEVAFAESLGGLR